LINLLFDVDDTLYDQLKPFEDAYQVVFDKYHFNCPVELLFVKSRYYSDQVFELVNEGKMEKREMHIYRITKAFESLGIEISRKDASLFQSYYEENQQRIVLHPQMKELIEFAFSHGVNLGIITNGPAEHQAKKISQLSLTHWINENNIFISGKLGIAKPEREIFSYVENKMSIHPKDSYYFGDSFMNDVVGSKRSGWNSVWINRRNHQVPTNTEYLPDYIIDENNSPRDVMKVIFDKHCIS
jgi:putative hydrolase of the HAD superfamily